MNSDFWLKLHLFVLTLSSNKGTKPFIVMWIPPEMKYWQKSSFRDSSISFSKKYTFLGSMYGTCLRSLAPLSPSNLPDNIPSHLRKVNLVFGTKNNHTELFRSLYYYDELYPYYLPKHGGLCIAVWSSLCMILHWPEKFCQALKNIVQFKSHL